MLVVKKSNINSGLILKLSLWILYSIIHSGLVFGDVLPSCQPQDFHYEYTECDSEGGRWRVSVPKPGVCTGGAPNAPVRGKGCDFTCKPGEYLDIENDQECKQCPSGQFSLGGGIRYEDFEDQIPKGFHSERESFNLGVPTVRFGNTEEESNCTGAGWYAKDGILHADIQECTSVLTYTANLVQAGSVSFIYQNEDDNLLFFFEIQNSQCQSVKDLENGKVLQTTKEGETSRETFYLKSGVNILYWRVFKPPYGRRAQAPGSQKNKITIHSIDVVGIAFTSACTPCGAGTYNNQQGQSACSDCPPNTFSYKGASECSKCDPISEYSDEGADKCIQKLPCTSNDYYEYNSPCNAKNMTQKLYKWIEPQLCRPDLSGAAKLPEAGEMEACPPCNPGMEFNNGSCHFCPPNHFSSGSGPCSECPGSTAPQTGLLYKWWNTLNSEYNITTNCLSSSRGGCSAAESWLPSGDHIRSGQGHKDDAYLTLNLKISGFKGREERVSGRAVPVARVSFVFELNCDGNCRFTFMERRSHHDYEVVRNWVGQTEQTLYEYDVTRTGSAYFTWAFLKSDTSYDTSSSNSVAKIYMINVTNTIQGGAQECKACPKGTSQDGCLPCPEGNYVDPDSKRCVPCPEGKVAGGLNPWGIESCIECGSGLMPSESRTSCVTACRYESPTGHSYDYTALAGLRMLNGSKLFTGSGYKYYNQFHISLCGGNGKHPMAVCSTNSSKYLSGNYTSVEIKSPGNLTLEDDLLTADIQAPICRVTIVPSNNEASPDIYTQPISLGDSLMAVTHKSDVYNISQSKEEAGFMKPEQGDTSHDVHFVYSSSGATMACSGGLRTIVTMRCDLTAGNNSQPALPAHCITGTCDGCTYMLLWRTPLACPRCDPKNFSEFTDVCENGKQKVLKIWPKDCYSEELSSRQILREKSCSILWQEHWPIWLKVIVICVPVILVSGCLLLIIVVHCWLKNRNLQYKYMKLVESSVGRGGEAELPAAETCALNEGEDDDQFDAVEYKTKGQNLLTKLGKIGRRKDKRKDMKMDSLNDETSRLYSFD